MFLNEILLLKNYIDSSCCVIIWIPFLVIFVVTYSLSEYTIPCRRLLKFSFLSSSSTFNKYIIISIFFNHLTILHWPINVFHINIVEILWNKYFCLNPLIYQSGDMRVIKFNLSKKVGQKFGIVTQYLNIMLRYICNSSLLIEHMHTILRFLRISCLRFIEVTDTRKNKPPIVPI